MRSIVLSGFMGTGKSTVGPLVAERLGLPFVDTDRELERESGRAVQDLWREGGEAAFRRRELGLVERLFAVKAPRVIAFGGGTASQRRARELALERAVVVTLTATHETILARVGPELRRRPNLGDAGEDIAARARELLAQRAEAYAECHAAIATDAAEPASIAGAILAVASRDPIAVPLGSRSYVVDVVDDAPSALTAAVARCAPSSLIVVTDANVHRCRQASLHAALAPLSLPTTVVTLAPGEEHKTLDAVGSIWDAALGAGIDREALVIGFGGGVVGDLAGFAASTLLRGLRTILVPTTLLSMVDASVGGKTGFDRPAGKNLLGTFHQPSGIVVDLAHLSTLPRRDRTAGLAEVVKVALAFDPALLREIERNATALAEGDPAALRPVIRRSIALKARVVRDDERESGTRAVLNVGHTIGHALEASGGYRKYLHGEAVALGTLVEVAATERLGWTPRPLVERARSVLARLGLPTEVSRDDVERAFPFVAADKKRAASRIRLPVLRAEGAWTLESLEMDTLRAAVLAGCPERSRSESGRSVAGV